MLSVTIVKVQSVKLRKRRSSKDYFFSLMVSILREKKTLKTTDNTLLFCQSIDGWMPFKISSPSFEPLSLMCLIPLAIFSVSFWFSIV